MKRFIQILGILLLGAILITSAGCLVPESKVDEAYNAGYEAYANPENPGPELKKAWGEIDELNSQLAALPRIRTSQEVMAFLRQDQTDKNKYSSPYYSPYFAGDLRINGQQAGFKVGVVLLILQNGVHVINVFETPDKGLFFIEPQFDQPVTVRVGENYWTQNGWKGPSFPATILETVILW